MSAFHQHPSLQASPSLDLEENHQGGTLGENGVNTRGINPGKIESPALAAVKGKGREARGGLPPEFPPLPLSTLPLRPALFCGSIPEDSGLLQEFSCGPNSVYR